MIYTINNCIRAFGYTNFDNLIADMGSVDNLREYVRANGYADIAVAEDTELLLVDVNGKTWHTGCYGANIKTYPDPYTMDYTDYQLVMFYTDDTANMKYMPFYSDGYEYTAPSIKDCMWACARPREDNKYYEGFDLVKFGELQDNEEYVLVKIWYNNASDDFTTARKDVGYVTPYNGGISCMPLNTGAEPIKFKKYSNKFKFELDGTEYYLYREINGTKLKLSAISTSSTDPLITRCILTKYTGTSTSDLPDSTSFEGTKVTITERNPLCFTSTGDSTVALEKTGKGHTNSIYYKIGDDGIWNLWDCTATSLSNNKKMYLERFDGSDGISSNNFADYCTFKMTGSIAASGDIASLIYYNFNPYSLTGCFANLFKDCTSLTQAPTLNNFGSIPAYFYSCMFQGCTSLTQAPNLPDSTARYIYESMFEGCTSLTSAPELLATRLAESCYSRMFSECTSLTQAPELPATTLELYCYQSMFNGCTSLTTAPELPATTLVPHCYDSMFRGCTSLVQAPVLLATTLTNGCYSDMFYGCTSLTAAPALPATTLGLSCYTYMFQGCTSLTQAPELPATTLESGCYYGMFKDCTKLNYVKAMFTDMSANNCVVSWLSNVSSTGTFIKNSAATWTNEQAGIPTGWTVQVEGGVTPEPEPARDYLCFTSTGDSTVAMTQNGTPDTSAGKVIQYKLNNGQWQTWDLSAVALADGDKMYLKSDDTIPISEAGNIYKYFVMTGYIAASGNVMSLIAFSDTLTNYGLCDLFKGCTSLTTAPELQATTLAYGCYSNMFEGCTSLTQAPALPATTLAVECYRTMFYGCTSLTTAPELPATNLGFGCYNSMFSACTSLVTAPSISAATLQPECYRQMFEGCTSLTQAPELPATTLEQYCYQSMFKGCTSLTTAPALPATTLNNGCYDSMFSGCTSLTTAPELPANTLVDVCYSSMFSGCTKLNYVKAMFTTNPAAGSYISMWLDSVSSTGTFVKNSAATWTNEQAEIPTGWTVQTASPDK